MPLTSNPSDFVRPGVALGLVAVHAVLILALMNLHASAPSRSELSAIEVRLISQSVDQPQWQPPKVAPLVPQINAPVPDSPVIEIPVADAALDRAISVPLAAAAPRQTAMQQGDVYKRIESVEYLREPEPRYPPQSRKLREQGLVVLRVLIDERGMACEVQVESSSGHDRLDRAAREAIARAEFRPFVEDGIARRALVLIPIEFSLNRNPARIAANGA